MYCNKCKCEALIPLCRTRHKRKWLISDRLISYQQMEDCFNRFRLIKYFQTQVATFFWSLLLLYGLLFYWWCRDLRWCHVRNMLVVIHSSDVNKLLIFLFDYWISVLNFLRCSVFMIFYFFTRIYGRVYFESNVNELLIFPFDYWF